MHWARQTDVNSHWLARPDHAFVYGSSVRVGAMRDVFVEATKDPALAMYDRDVAMRTAERLPLVSDYDHLTPAAITAIANRYRLDYMVTERRLPFDVAYDRAPLIVYDLRPLVSPAGLD
jgi:hypothetical protein